MCCTSICTHPCTTTNNSEINTCCLEIPLKRMEIYSEITGRVTVLSPRSVPFYLTTAGVEGFKLSLRYWTPWRRRSQDGIFYQNLVNNLTELEMAASISTQRGESHRESFLQKRSGEILWIMYELYDCTPSKNKS